MELAEMVKTLRTQMGLTQEELARRSGLEQSTISAIEHQKRGYRWSRRTLEKFAKGFGKKLVVRFE
jgi:transcriptional regulator with XRE-family HTH domain